VEPISPELVLVDPELAWRARALLPDPRRLDLSPAPAAPLPSTTPVRRRRDRLIRAAAWLAVPSIALNVAVFRTDSVADPAPVSAPPPRVVTVTVAPIAPRSHPPVKRQTALPKKGVASAEHSRVARSRPTLTGPRGVLRWPARKSAVKYDVVVWRSHRRIADVWTAKPKIAVARLACRGGKHALATGRYLWFVYPLVTSKPRRYGRLAKWGTFAVGARARCPQAAKTAP
jgi:hypothetical protein